MSNPLPPELTSEKPRKDAPDVPDTIGPSGPENSKNVQPKKKRPPKKIDQTILSLDTPPVKLDPEDYVKIEVESHIDSPEKSGGLVGLLKTAKMRAEVNEDTSDPDSKKSVKKDGQKKSRNSPAATDKEEFTTLVFTVLTIVLSFSNLPPEIRPVEDEVKSLAYNIGSILVRHLPAIGNMSPDLLDIMGITGTLALWYQRVGPELKRIQAEKISGRGATKSNPDKSNGNRPSVLIEDEGPADPINDVSFGSGDFLKKVHQGGKNGN